MNDPKTQANLEAVAREWLASRNVIIGFLREIAPNMRQSHLEHNAAAILARLASHEPPILTRMVDLSKPDPEDECDRLRAVNAELLAACRAALEQLEEVPGRHEPTACTVLRKAIANATKE